MEFWDLRMATTVMGYVLALALLGLYLVILMKIATDRIDLGSIISDGDSGGKTSISRFQLLVFTMTIAGLYVILSIENGQLIEVPNGALALLGISSSAFVVSKAVGKPKTPPTDGSGSTGHRTGSALGGGPAPSDGQVTNVLVEAPTSNFKL